jgi:hypothetical protein
MPIKPKYNKTVTFPVNGYYGLDEAKIDFGSCIFWQNKQAVIDNKLQVLLQRNAFGPAGGAMSRFDTPDSRSYTITQYIKFNGEFGKGGKVGFGFLFGQGHTGGVSGKDGGSVRLMWNGAELKPYIYHADQSWQYGDDFGHRYPIQAGVEYKIAMTLTCSTGSLYNGILTIWVNDKMWFSINLRTSLNNSVINKICFENFRGGNDLTWAVGTDAKIIFDNINIRQL